MNTLEMYNIFYKYIDKLMQNQNDTHIDCLQNIFSPSDYKRLLKPVLNVIKANPNASITYLRYQLFQKSGIKELIYNFIYQTEITPGLILDFGTKLTRDTVMCGLSQEYIMQNDNMERCEKQLEEDTILDLASTSKLFTAIAILKLEEMGLLDLYEPITKYVPQFKGLSDTTIYDLLKFRVKIITESRVDSAKNPSEAEEILFTVHPALNQNFNNAYTDMGAMVLRYVVEKVSKMPFKDFVEEAITKYLGMEDTYLQVPKDKLYRVANENYSTIITKSGMPLTRIDNVPGTPHDAKAMAIGELNGIAPGHAGWFSTKKDMIKLGNALIDGKILSPESVLSMSDTATGFKDEDGFTRFYGSLVYLKQPDVKNLSVYHPLSGRSFMSPGFAGTTLVVDPLNKITLFIGSPRLHNRIYQVHPDQQKNIKVDAQTNKKTFVLPTGEEKVICSDFTKLKEVMVTLALDLSLQYQLLEKILKPQKEMHLVRELN